MTDDRKSGIALIAGSFGGLLTMAIHPTAAGHLTPDQVAHLAVASAMAHSLAIVSFVLVFLGVCGLVRRIAAADRFAFSGIVVYGVACVAVLIATAVSGFIVPDMMRLMARDVPAAAQQWKIVISSIFQINQAFARIYTVAASLAIILWSVSALRNGGLGRKVAIYGCVIAPLIILGIVSGHLRLDVHGMGAVVLGQAIWFVVVGAQIYSADADKRVSAAT
jgi:hypothetical protein